MKHMKKLMASLLVAVLALALGSAVALAADYSITVDNSDSDSQSIVGKTVDVLIVDVSDAFFFHI